LDSALHVPGVVGSVLIVVNNVEEVVVVTVAPVDTVVSGACVVVETVVEVVVSGLGSSQALEILISAH